MEKYALNNNSNNAPNPAAAHKKAAIKGALVNPYSDAETYYSAPTQRSSSPTSRLRSFSVSQNMSNDKTNWIKTYQLQRRGSEDVSSFAEKGKRLFFIEDVNKTLEDLLKREDTDSNYQITIEDKGSKVLKLGTASSEGYKFVNIRGTYMLSNLLQELTLAKRYHKSQIFLDESRLNESPVNRLQRLISTAFWKSLTRRIDGESILKLARDTKFEDESTVRIYIPYNCPDQYDFFTKAIGQNPLVKLEVEYLPKDITPEYVQSINSKPGLLTLAMDKVQDPVTGKDKLVGWPYVVPGGRFNEFYGWDSYFITLGLVESQENVDLCRGMVENFVFEIDHYGKILNANRSYYLCRSQPPFLTDMALQVFKKLGGSGNQEAVDFLKRSFNSAIKEYKNVWHCKPRLHESTGLSCYHPDGLGIPPETEKDHFDSVLQTYADKYNVSIDDFKEKYNSREIKDASLDDYFLHDRAIRESGHDTTNRFEGHCCELATVDLNSLLYKYEVDIAHVIEKYFDDKHIDFEGVETTSKHWADLAARRKKVMNKLLWDEEKGMYFDYNIKSRKRTTFESATTFWPLWAGLATQDQADKMVKNALPLFELFGGLVSTTERSRGVVSKSRPQRQWDYPYGWAPHQILAWIGLEKYGYPGEVARLAYRWLYIITKVFVDYNGAVVEKYDVTSEIDPHRVSAEYGNQGIDFKGVAEEGFGWVNTSYVMGLKYMTRYSKRALNNCVSPKIFFERLPPKEKKLYGL